MKRLAATIGLVGAVLVIAILGAVTVGSVLPTDAPALDDETHGLVDGVRYDDDIAVTGTDGLNASERAAMTTRAMARLERLRDIEFRERVNVTVVTREEYRANYSSPFNATHEEWNNQVWEGLFLVGSDRDVSDVFNDTFRSTVIGYYEPGTGNIVLVSNSDQPRLARRTLVHELVHALQDQQFGLGDRPDVQDQQLSRNAVVEGEAERLATMYEERCREEWSCVDAAPPGGGQSGGGASDNSEPGRYQNQVFQVIYHPYAAGPGFVRHVAERGGTDALNSLYDGYPDSTEQIIHPESYPDERPIDVSVRDRSGGEWDRFDHDPVADTVGEASIAVLADVHGLGERRGDRYDYRNTVSEGWGGDALVPYRPADPAEDEERAAGADEFGYVWETAWDTPADAREFREAYETLLDEQGGETVGEDTYRLPAESAYSGAYRVTHEGQTVRIVHGPTLDALSGIHAVDG